MSTIPGSVLVHHVHFRWRGGASFSRLTELSQISPALFLGKHCSLEWFAVCNQAIRETLGLLVGQRSPDMACREQTLDSAAHTSYIYIYIYIWTKPGWTDSIDTCSRARRTLNTGLQDAHCCCEYRTMRHEESSSSRWSERHSLFFTLSPSVCWDMLSSYEPAPGVVM